MTEPDWSARVTQVVGREIRRHRDERNMSAQQLSDACDKLGVPIERSVISNLENKRRAIVSVPELLALARALGVPPLMLVFPVGREEEVEVLPGKHVPTWQAVMWFTGEAPFPGSESEPDGQGAAPILLFREYFRRLEQHADARAAAHAARQAATDSRDGGVSDLREAAAHDGARAFIEEHIRRLRSVMRGLDLIPPPLPPGLDHLDGQGQP